MINRILVTGATGFIGSHLTKRLVKKNFEVGIVKRRSSDIRRIKDLIDKVKVYNLDLEDTESVINTISHFRPQVIFHLAAHYAVEHSLQELSSMTKTNVLGVINLLEASRKFGIELFVNTSSCFVYKESKDKLKESDPLNPLNLYALTKIYTEQACTFYVEKYGLRVVTFRLFPPYGPFDHLRRLIPYTIKSFLEGREPRMTTGKQKWDFVYVDDVVEAYLRILFVYNLIKTHEIFNIGTGEAISIREIVLRIKEIMNTELEPKWNAIPHRKNEVWFMCADIKKIETFLKWKPRIHILDEGLKLTIEWYKRYLTKKGG